MDHIKQTEINLLLGANLYVLLVGPPGSGKTTALQKAAKSAGVKYSFIAGTRQTTVSNILGFMSVNGTYVRSVFREAYEHGHYFNVDEADGMDANCMLVFNSLENNIVAFPDGYSEPPHKNFRFCATANPMNEHSTYTGRSKMDAAVLDRFDIVEMVPDEALEKSLVEESTYVDIEIARKCLKDVNSSTYLSMRDSLRYQKRKDLKLGDNYIERLLCNDSIALKEYSTIKAQMPRTVKISDCNTLSEVWGIALRNSQNLKST